MTLASRQLRAEVRSALGCGCEGRIEAPRGVHLSKSAEALGGELKAIESIMGERPPTCPWEAFRDPEVGEVLRAYDFFESGQLDFYAGEDPAWRLVEGVQHYHRALGIARADVRKLAKSKSTPRPPPPGVRRSVTRG